MTKTYADAARELAAKAGLTSLKTIAHAMGFRGASSVQRYFDPKEFDAKTPLPLSFARKLGEAITAAGYPVNKAEVLTLTGLGDAEPPEEGFPLIVAPPARPADHRPGTWDLPVYGAAEGGAGVMILDNDPIEYMIRPAELQGVKGAYAVYVVNDSMFPAYEPGDKVHIHPGKPIAPGKDAMFTREERDGTRHALIKRIVKVTEKAWKVRQFNPDKTYELSRTTWQRAFRIVGSTRAD